MNNYRLQQKYVKLSIILTDYTKHIIISIKKANGLWPIVYLLFMLRTVFPSVLGFGCDLIDQCCESVASALQSAECWTWVTMTYIVMIVMNNDSGVKLFCDGLKNPVN